jgi:hypothetical protein
MKRSRDPSADARSVGARLSDDGVVAVGEVCHHVDRGLLGVRLFFTLAGLWTADVVGFRDEGGAGSALTRELAFKLSKPTARLWRPRRHGR